MAEKLYICSRNGVRRSTYKELKIGDNVTLDEQETTVTIDAVPSGEGGLAVTEGLYSGDGVNNRAMAHGLGAKPQLMIIMSTSTGEVYHGYCPAASRWVTLGGATDTVAGRTTTNFYLPSGDINVQLNTTNRVYKWIAIG